MVDIPAIGISEDAEGSAGHRLGQVIGNWWEQYLVLPLLNQVANRLDLYLDTRFRTRACRDDKIIWADADGNQVDYDFALELGGTDEGRGIPVGFLEVFWRRGSRHSKDKARDDTGKLVPMRETYPTARFLGILACGDFTQPARDLILNRRVDLFCVPKEKIVQAFQANGLVMDYADRSPEAAKSALATEFAKQFVDDAPWRVAETLVGLVGPVSIEAYSSRVIAALGALPQELRFIESRHSRPEVFESIREASAFLAAPSFEMDGVATSYRYEITYSDGTEFERDVATLGDLRALHDDVQQMADHLEKIARDHRI